MSYPRLSGRSTAHRPRAAAHHGFIGAGGRTLAFVATTASAGRTLTPSRSGAFRFAEPLKLGCVGGASLPPKISVSRPVQIPVACSRGLSGGSGNAARTSPHRPDRNRRNRSRRRATSPPTARHARADGASHLHLRAERVRAALRRKRQPFPQGPWSCPGGRGFESRRSPCAVGVAQLGASVAFTVALALVDLGRSLYSAGHLAYLLALPANALAAAGLRLGVAYVLGSRSTCRAARSSRRSACQEVHVQLVAIAPGGGTPGPVGAQHPIPGVAPLAYVLGARVHNLAGLGHASERTPPGGAGHHPNWMIYGAGSGVADARKPAFARLLHTEWGQRRTLPTLAQHGDRRDMSPRLRQSGYVARAQHGSPGQPPGG